jgi:hypothetical protein
LKNSDFYTKEHSKTNRRKARNALQIFFGSFFGQAKNEQINIWRNKRNEHNKFVFPKILFNFDPTNQIFLSYQGV